jgi:hypothetical protein
MQKTLTVVAGIIATLPLVASAQTSADLYTTMWGSFTSVPILISIRDFKKRKQLEYIDTVKYSNFTKK